MYCTKISRTIRLLLQVGWDGKTVRTLRNDNGLPHDDLCSASSVIVVDRRAYHTVAEVLGIQYGDSQIKLIPWLLIHFVLFFARTGLLLARHV
jgi:hypothetical protein